MINTLDELLKAIEHMPLEAFADLDKVHSVGSCVQLRERAWRGTDGYKAVCERDQDKLVRRQERDAANAKRREKWARQNVKAGMFIKVNGARDGVGLREVISVAMDGVICRQWLPNGRRRPLMSNKDLSFSKRDWSPEAQMTTHTFSKVTGYFTTDVNGRYWLQKIV